MRIYPKRFSYLLLLLLVSLLSFLFYKSFYKSYDKSHTIDNHTIDNHTKSYKANQNETKFYLLPWEPPSGYGNRMYKVLTAITISWLTDRKLYIEWPELKGFVKEQFSWSYGSPKQQTSEIIPDMTNIWKVDKDIRSIIKTRVEYEEKDVMFRYDVPYFFEVCSNPVYYEKLYRLGLVRPKTVQVARKAIAEMTNETKDSSLIDSVYLIGNKGWELHRRHYLQEFGQK